jgi:hypothetical protein
VRRNWAGWPTCARPGIAVAGGPRTRCRSRRSRRRRRRPLQCPRPRLRPRPVPVIHRRWAIYRGHPVGKPRWIAHHRWGTRGRARGAAPVQRPARCPGRAEVRCPVRCPARAEVWCPVRCPSPAHAAGPAHRWTIRPACGTRQTVPASRHRAAPASRRPIGAVRRRAKAVSRRARAVSPRARAVSPRARAVSPRAGASPRAGRSPWAGVVSRRLDGLGHRHRPSAAVHRRWAIHRGFRTRWGRYIAQRQWKVGVGPVHRPGCGRRHGTPGDRRHRTTNSRHSTNSGAPGRDRSSRRPAHHRIPGRPHSSSPRSVVPVPSRPAVAPNPAGANSPAEKCRRHPVPPDPPGRATGGTRWLHPQPWACHRRPGGCVWLPWP